MTNTNDVPGGLGGWFLKTFGPTVEKVLTNVLTKEIQSMKADIEAKIDAKIDDFEARLGHELDPIEQAISGFAGAFTGVNSNIDSQKDAILGGFKDLFGPFQQTVAQFEQIVQNLPHIPNIPNFFGEHGPQ